MKNPRALVVLESTSAREARARGCKDCGACCDPSNVPSLNKPAGTRCRHYDPGRGCSLYGKPERPSECAAFECLWLVGAGEQKHRPDRLGVFLAVHEPKVRVEGQPERLFVAVETHVGAATEARTTIREISHTAPIRVVAYPKEGTKQ